MSAPPVFFASIAHSAERGVFGQHRRFRDQIQTRKSRIRFDTSG